MGRGRLEVGEDIWWVLEIQSTPHTCHTTADMCLVLFVAASGNGRLSHLLSRLPSPPLRLPLLPLSVFPSPFPLISRSHLRQELPTLLRKPDRHLHGLVRRVLQQQMQQLEAEDLVRHLLVDEVGDESCEGDGHHLVVTFVPVV